MPRFARQSSPLAPRVDIDSRSESSTFRFGWLAVCLLVIACPLRAAEKDADDAKDAKKPKAVTWAHIKLEGNFPEGAQSPGLFGDLVQTLADALDRLEKAEGDEDVSGVVLHLNNPQIGWAKLNEFRQAIERVRAGGKTVYAYMDSPSTMDYLLACSCDKVVMPESGVVMMLGLRAEVTFYKNLFDKLDIQPDILRVGAYKSAAEPYTRTSMSEPFREEMTAILDDYYAHMVETIAKGRKLDPEKVKQIIDNGPHTAKAAKELGLIDLVAYEDQLDELIADGKQDHDVSIDKGYGKKKVDTDFEGFSGMIKLMNLLMGNEPQKRAGSKPQIAVIYATGVIMPGDSTSDLFGSTVLGSDTIVKAVRKANEDENVKAIVLRVDSPGGSALASDLMWNALEKVEKPFIVSMGDVAASGGYYISMGADTIFAEPGTLTGSIGVVGGKLAFQGLFEKVGITTDVISRGKNSGAMSMTQPFSESEREAMQKLLNDIYEQFTRKAAKGRDMEYEKLEKLARGRVYTGRQAKDVGLVDELGTLEDAIAYAAEKADVEVEDVERMVLPRPASPFEALFGPISPEEERLGAAKALLGTVESLAPELARQLEGTALINVLAREPRLTVLPFRLVVK